MREAIDKLDYVGFTYNNIHSSQLGLKSVSSGNRYQKDLLPVAQDYTTDVLGGDGTYFFGTKFKNNDMNLSIAFDDVSELEIREISKWLYNNGEIGTLILDESPYIKYYVKVTSRPQIKYLTFEDSYGARVHKGEMNLTFTGYDPYGYCTEKWLSDYEDDNVGEWAEASGLLFSKKVNNVDYYDTYIPPTSENVITNFSETGVTVQKLHNSNYYIYACYIKSGNTETLVATSGPTTSTSYIFSSLNVTNNHYIFKIFYVDSNMTTPTHIQSITDLINGDILQLSIVTNAFYLEHNLRVALNQLGTLALYNPGDLEVDFILTLEVNRGNQIDPISNIIVILNEENYFVLNTSNITNMSTITIDTKKRLIKNGNTIVNNILINGNLFKIPVSKIISLTITGVNTAEITYPYKFL